MLAHPRLTDYVKYVRFRNCKQTSIWTVKPSNDELQSIINLVRTSGLANSYPIRRDDDETRALGDKEPWLQDIWEGQIELYQALLVSRLPNLKFLQIGMDATFGLEYISAILHYTLFSANPQPGFSMYRQLQKVELCSGFYRRDLSGYDMFRHAASDVLPFFYLPSLQEFTAVIPLDDFPFSWPSVPPRADTLRILRLQRCHMKEKELGQLLAATPKLVVLEYDFCCQVGYSGDRSIQILDCNGLDYALAHVKESLETLRVSVHFYGCSTSHYFDPRLLFATKGVLNSLKDFERLVEIEIPFPLLLRSDFKCDDPMVKSLPLSIQSVILRDDMGSYTYLAWRSGCVLGCLPEYLRLWAIQNLSLQSIGLNLEESPEDWDEGALEDFRILCLRIGTIPIIHKKPWKNFLNDSWPLIPVFATGRFS